MEKYYKTSRNSETGRKFSVLTARAVDFDVKVEELRKKYGFQKVATRGLYYKELSAVEFSEQPDMTIWKEVKDAPENIYSPRAKSKSILKDFAAVNEYRIMRSELDEIVGNDDFFHSVGFDFSVPEVYLFIIEHNWKMKIPADCTEISNLEFAELSSLAAEES